jgi:hypothetical protein
MGIIWKEAVVGYFNVVAYKRTKILFMNYKGRGHLGDMRR